MDKLDYWIRTAELDGDEVFFRAHDHAMMTCSTSPKKLNGVLHAAVFGILFLAGFATFGIAWALLIPYLIFVSILSIRARRPRPPMMYRLSVAGDGGALTDPGGRDWWLRAKARELSKR